MKEIRLPNSRHLIKKNIASIDQWPKAADEILLKLNSLSSVQVSNRDVYIHFEEDKIHISRIFTGFLNLGSDSSYEVVDFEANDAQYCALQIGDIYDKREDIEAKITNAGISLEDDLKYWLRTSFGSSENTVSLEYFKTH